MNPEKIDYACAIERRQPEKFWTPIRIALCITYLVALITVGVVL